MEKAPIKKFAVEARRKLIDDVRSQLGRYGITESGILEPHTVTDNEVIIDLGNGNTQTISGKQAVAQYRNLVSEARNFYTADKPQQAIDNFCEKWAYTWFNRLIAVRFMEVNRYIPVRVLSSEIAGQNVPDLVKSPFSGDLEFTSDEKQHIYALQDANDKEDEIFRLVFFKQCNDLNRILPRLFENLDSGDSFSELLVVLSFNDPNGVVYRLVNRVEEEWFDIHAKDENGNQMGQIQIIGWMYQYYNAEPKDAVFAALKKNVKISKENIPAATQLFTPDWIVRYMVENSLGRLWSEGHPGFDKSEWKYYLDEAQQEPQVVQELEEIRSQYAKLEPEQIKVIDPCMGSGHILCYLFDVLMQIYLDWGYSKREAVRSILENNLFGLEIDNRAAQIAYFAVMMKAREYDGSFFDRSYIPQPKVYEILESNGINRNQLNFFGNGLSGFERNEARLQLDGLLDTLTDAKEYGSILNMGSYNWDLLRNCAEAAGEDAQVSMESIGLENTVKQLKSLIDIAEALGQKYDVVVTNPPYMGSNGFNFKMSCYVKKHYDEVKTDLFAVFMIRCKQLTNNNGFQSMITQHSWMTLSSYEWLRKQMNQMSITSMVHLGTRAFSEISGEMVSTTAFCFRNSKMPKYIAKFSRLVDYPSEIEKREAFFDSNNIHEAKQSSFEKIPGIPYAYWVSENVAKAFEVGKSITDYVDTFQGIITGDNDKFLRYWHEVSAKRIPFHATNMNSVDLSRTYWIPYNKGGEFRKWYGVQDYVVYWRNGPDDKTRGKKGFANYYLKKYVAWSYTISNSIATRIYPAGFLWDVRGSGIMDKSNMLLYLEGLISSKVGITLFKVNNSTLSCQVENIVKLPIILDKREKSVIDTLVEKNNDISQNEWDSFETSWDFEEHPLV